MKRPLQAVVVVLSAIGAGLVAYFWAVAVGASHTVCQGTGTVRYCDTKPTLWALVALVAGAIVGAIVAAVLLRHRRSPSGS